MLDCATPNICNAAGECVAPDVMQAADDDEGCACRVGLGASKGSVRPLWILVLAGIGMACRPRRESWRE